MNPFRLIYETALEALFPTPRSEKWLLSMDTDSILKALPRAKNMPIPEACSVFAYKDERVWRLIWDIKYKKSKRAAEISAAALHNVIQIYGSIIPKVIVIPMPVSRQRRRERGFNQCELIADEMRKLDIKKRFIFVYDLLLRKKNTSRQTLKDREDRLHAAHELFVIHEKALEKLKSEHIVPTEANHSNGETMMIVIDDVVTTGATMKEAVHAVRNAGFANTWGLSVAH